MAHLALGGGIVYAAQPPVTHWEVIASSKLDSRLQREINALATRDGTTVRFILDDAPAAEPDPAKLIVELQETIDPTTWTPEMDREGYRLVATYRAGQGPRTIRISAKTAAGFHHGLARIPGMLRYQPGDSADPGPSMIPAPQRADVSRSADLVTVSISDFPSFPERGIVEGFYGKPWSHQDRLEMLRFEGAHRMNVYYYAPKDDPYHRHRWKSPYPPREYRRLGDLVTEARASFVDFCFAISPGLSMRYSNESDFRQLTAKLASVGKLGVTCFALFLDDVPPEIRNAGDRARFQTLAEAHASLINRLHEHLRAQSPQNRLVVTPTTYTHAWGRRDYIAELGALTRREIPLVWTGIDTFSPVITSAQAREWGDLLKRPPLVWDNFPVNDAEPWRPHLGPLTGRGPDLPTATQGFFSNPMNQARASRIPLSTVADYLWNPPAYDPARSLANALRDQYGENGAQLLDPFLMTYSDNHWDDNLFTPLFYSRAYPLDTEAMDKRLRRLERTLQELAGLTGFREIATELAPFIPRTRKRLEEVLASPAFERLPDGRLAPRADYDRIEALRLAQPPVIDGNFSKWETGRFIALDQKSQIHRGANLWKGPESFSARVALRWDSECLYVGVDVTDLDLNQTRVGRGINDGDFFSLTLQTAFRRNYSGTTPTGDEVRIYFSPGNFAQVPPSLFSDEDYLPPRNRPHDHAREIRTAWLKTPLGYSGDIAIPVSYFEGGSFREGYEIGLGFAVQNVVRKQPGSRAGSGVGKIIFISKRNSLFPVYLGNPSSYPRLVLVD